jgi:hypothetical protein
MVFLGALSLAYGLLFMQIRMFAIFDPEMPRCLASPPS